jgi:hypothetical protein
MSAAWLRRGNDFLDQRAKHNEVDVGVAENLTGTRLQRRGERATNAL